MDRGRQKYRLCPAIELYKRGDEPIELPRCEAILQDSMFECLSLVETSHDHEPVDDFCIATDRESVRHCGEGYHVEIDVRRQPTIESELSPAGGFPPPQGREIEIGKADRFLELVDPVAGEKYPGHMGLTAERARYRRAIGGGAAQEVDLLVKRRLLNAACNHVITHRMLPAAAIRRPKRSEAARLAVPCAFGADQSNVTSLGR